MGEETKPRRRVPMGCVVVLILMIGAVVTWFVMRNDDRYRVALNFFEKNPPKISFVSPPPGVGFEPTSITIAVSDEGTGLDEVVVRSDQAGEIRELLRKRYPEALSKDTIKVELEGKKLGLTEGDFQIVVSAFDRSFWSNGDRQSVDLPVDYIKPRIEVISAQHNATVGGTELAFYRVSYNDNGPSGVKVGDHEFLGYPARLLDTEFETVPDVYFSFFAIPAEFDERQDKVVAFARDPVGNVATASFYYKAAKSGHPIRLREVDDLYLETQVHSLYEKFLDNGSSAEPSTLEQFRLVTSKLRKVSNQKLDEVLRISSDKGSAVGPMALPPSMLLRVNFGDVRRYVYGEEQLGDVMFHGAEFSAANGTPVVAAHAGKVSFVGELGVYGETVVLDHGFGLQTVYAQLDEIRVKVGEDIALGGTLGTAGQSGLAGFLGMYFEVRVHGVPVKPVEWWDKRWMRDHVENKIADMKKQLSLGEGGADEPTNQ